MYAGMLPEVFIASGMVGSLLNFHLFFSVSFHKKRYRKRTLVYSISKMCFWGQFLERKRFLTSVCSQIDVLYHFQHMVFSCFVENSRNVSYLGEVCLIYYSTRKSEKFCIDWYQTVRDKNSLS